MQHGDSWKSRCVAPMSNEAMLFHIVLCTCTCRLSYSSIPQGNKGTRALGSVDTHQLVCRIVSMNLLAYLDASLRLEHLKFCEILIAMETCIRVKICGFVTARLRFGWVEAALPIHLFPKLHTGDYPLCKFQH